MRPIEPSVLERDLLLKGVWEGLGTPRCLVTGGYVRDRLLGRVTFDLDLVLPGDLEAVRGPARRLAARLDASAHSLGHGETRVWRIETADLKVELWPLGDLSLEQDIRRRDFTCNALMWSLPDGPLDDRVGGVPDLERQTLRALARENLQQDPVRLIRAPRFLAQLDGFRIDGNTTAWIRGLAPRLTEAPRERIGPELTKLVDAPNAVSGIRSLLELGLFEAAAPPCTRCDRDWITRNLSAISRLTGSAPHSFRAAVSEAGIAARLGLLLRAWGLPAPDSIAPYAWSRSRRRDAARAATLLDNALSAVGASVAERRSLIHRAGTSFPAVLALAAAVEPDRPWGRWWRLWRERGEDLVDPEPLLDSKEIANLLAIAPGPDLGRAIEALIEAQVRGTVRTAGGARAWLERTFNGSTRSKDG